MAKVLRFGSRRLNLGLDLYNLFNANPATTYESMYDPSDQRRALDAADGSPATRARHGSTRSSTSETRSDTHRLQRRTDQAKRGVR